MANVFRKKIKKERLVPVEPERSMNEEKKKPLSIFGLASGKSIFGLSTTKGVTTGVVSSIQKKAIPLCCQQMMAKPATKDPPAQVEVSAPNIEKKGDFATKIQEKLENLEKKVEIQVPQVSESSEEPVTKPKSDVEPPKDAPKQGETGERKQGVHGMKLRSDIKQRVEGGDKEVKKRGRKPKKYALTKQKKKNRVWAPSEIWTFSLVYNGPRDDEGGAEQDVAKEEGFDNVRQTCGGFVSEDANAKALTEVTGDDAVEQGGEENVTELREERANDDKGEMHSEWQHGNVSDVHTESKNNDTNSVVIEQEQGNVSDTITESKKNDTDLVIGGQEHGNVSDISPESKKVDGDPVMIEKEQENVSDNIAESKKNDGDLVMIEQHQQGIVSDTITESKKDDTDLVLIEQEQGIMSDIDTESKKVDTDPVMIEQEQENVSDSNPESNDDDAGIKWNVNNTCAEGKLDRRSDGLGDITSGSISWVVKEDRNETQEQLNANMDHAQNTEENHASKDEPAEEGIHWVHRDDQSGKGDVQQPNSANNAPQQGSGQAEHREESTRETMPASPWKGITTHFNVDPTDFLASKITTSQSDSSLAKRPKENPTCDLTELRTKTAVERLIGKLTNTEIAPAGAQGKKERFIPPFFQQRSEPTQEEPDKLLPMNDFEKDLFVDKKRKKKPMPGAKILGISHMSISQKLKQAQTMPKAKAHRRVAHPIDVDTSSSDDDEIGMDFEAALAMAAQHEVNPMKKSRSVEMNPIPFNPKKPKKKQKQEKDRTISFTMRKAWSKVEELEFTNTCSSAAPKASRRGERDRTIHFTYKAWDLSSLKFTNEPAQNLHSLCERPQRTITFTNKTSNVTQIAFTDERDSLLEHIKATYRAISDANAPEPALLPDPSELDSQFLVASKRFHH